MIGEAVARHAERLFAVADAIHDRPEVAFAEHEAAALLAAEAERAGFAVTRGAYGLATAFEAIRGDGPFRVVVCAEYDALPGIGHGCGHHVIAAAGLGAVLALAEVASEHGLTVVLLGTPAEESGGGKALLLDRGAWDGATLSVMAHPAGEPDVPCGAVRTRAMDRFEITFTGRSAHASAAPHEAVNAGDAATVALAAIGLLRQHLPDGVRTHAFVAHGGETTNVIPALTRVRLEVRADDVATLDGATARVLRCIEAGAVATGCAWEARRTERRYEELVQDPFLAGCWDDALRDLGRTVVAAAPAPTGSTDMGNVSRVVPSIHPLIALRGATAPLHTPEFAAQARGDAAREAIVHAAVALARTVVAAASEPQRERYLGRHPRSYAAPTR
ncbi:amidohydrolase [Pseudonocardia sp.]|uniref:amidohydrolase n=1 Tax=Pseudonocardia sp. TaxID=60912 RepID=UPI003D0EC8D2